MNNSSAHSIFLSFRYFGHSMSDPSYTYRTREEVEMWRHKKDPVNKFTKLLIEFGLGKEDHLNKLKKECKDEVKKAVEQAKKDPVTDVKELTADCYGQYSDLVRLPGYMKLSKHKNCGYYKADNNN